MPVCEYKGCALNYWMDGPANAPLVVFTPGAFTDHTMFDAQVGVVCQRYRMLRWDVRGHGLSRPSGLPFTTMQAAEDLAALLDHVGYRRAALVGQSIGGNIAQDFIFKYPDRCAATVLLGCTCSTLNLTWTETLMLRLTPAIINLYPLNTFKRQAMMASAITKEARERLLAMVEPLSADDVRNISLGIASAPHPEAGYKITCPTMIAYGAHDDLGNIKKVAKRWADRDSAVGPIVIGRAGHVANMDNPVGFNRDMMEFLDSVYPS